MHNGGEWTKHFILNIIGSQRIFINTNALTIVKLLAINCELSAYY